MQLGPSVESRRPSWGLQCPALKGDGKERDEIQACAVEVVEQGQAGGSAEASPGFQPASQPPNRRAQEDLSSPGESVCREQKELKVRAEEQVGADKPDGRSCSLMPR